MSRALILMAQTRFLKRSLTPEETTACLEAWAAIAAGQRVYIPAPLPPSLFNDIADLRANGWSIRRIARKLQISKSQVHRELSRVSSLESGQTPA
jgi:DNA-binding NarL/FixJ family response regulator